MHKIFAVVVLMIGAISVRAHAAASPQICFQKVCVDVEVVSKDEDMIRGLQGRKGLEKNKGMLFVFNADGIYPFWMKDMQFPIDILWMDNKTKLIDISAAVPACTKDTCPTYAPNGPVHYVLEVESGFAAAHGLKAGDKAAFKNLP